ncbi:glutamine--tRNA ligase/YqeY domain fusion protein [Anaeromicropila herbilytica]|uniref:Glutamine--tRNA ligase n=1 Tax=Anaeromicropila herbilytica TaxID=2785025 RepID=A0A7R7ENW3_9FIRM|nr:glutamine--tRNA ligase/YqeY domain fusion protein [Anaeromicropila herbilytica]BCN32340.1 glutamine--tRNA ligase [Anaeromicropila herbilytica]
MEKDNLVSEKEVISKNFIEQIIDKDIEEGHCKTVQTRFPPEPNGYLHIGHAKSILLNSGLANKYNGKFNLRFDDTNPTKEKTEFVESIIEDVKWIGGDFEDRLFFASNYFEQMYEAAIKLIKKGKAYVCDLTPEEIREYRGTLTEPGKNSPYRDRSIDENLELFEDMKNGEYPDGSKVLRAKIDMASGNINMRDPIIYRVARMTHHNTGDTWCIYPMYDFAHPIEDAIEGITHSICTLEFEDHRPLYDWVVTELEYENPPKQIEFAKLYLTNVITGKRYIKKLVDDGIVDGWDDPRLVSISALRRRGFTPESIRMFMELCGVSKSQSSVDYAMLEYCIREDLKLKKPRMMAVLDPIKLVITNYPEGEIEYVDVANNQENPEMGSRQVPFGRELYIEREDFMVEPPKKYYRLFPGNEVRLMHAYFVKCENYITDDQGNVLEVHCTYDKATKSGSGFNERKVKGTIHWVEATTATKAEVRLYENIVDEEKGVYNEDGSLNLNPNSLNILKECYLEPSFGEAKRLDSYQFLRHGYFCVDSKDSKEDNLVFNRIVSLKSSYKPV